MRYIIIGAGAVGGAIGGRLYESGHEVVLVARGAHFEALRTDGLRLLTPDTAQTLPVPVVDGPGSLPLRADDVLVLAVKTQDSLAALDAWAGQPVAGGGTAAERLPLVCAQNGVENERLALRRFQQVYGMCVWLPSTYLEPGRIAAAGAPLTGILHLGAYPGGAHAPIGNGAGITAELIAGDLEKSHFLAPVRPDVMRWKYGKLLGNLGNSLEAVCGPITSDKGIALYLRAMAEGKAALAAAGIAYASTEEEERTRGDQVQVLPVEGVERGGGSSWQSLARGAGSIEADYLNGEIVLLGRLHGVPTPVNETLQRVAGRFARERRAPGSMPLAELEALIG